MSTAMRGASRRAEGPIVTSFADGVPSASIIGRLAPMGAPPPTVRPPHSSGTNVTNAPYDEEEEPIVGPPPAQRPPVARAPDALDALIGPGVDMVRVPCLPPGEERRRKRQREEALREGVPLDDDDEDDDADALRTGCEVCDMPDGALQASRESASVLRAVYDIDRELFERVDDDVIFRAMADKFNREVYDVNASIPGRVEQLGLVPWRAAMVRRHMNVCAPTDARILKRNINTLQTVIDTTAAGGLMERRSDAAELAARGAPREAQYECNQRKFGMVALAMKQQKELIKLKHEVQAQTIGRRGGAAPTSSSGSTVTPGGVSGVTPFTISAGAFPPR